MRVPDLQPDFALKKCSKCGNKKDRIEFSKNAAAKDGLHYWCKKCQNAALKEAREAKKQNALNNFRVKMNPNLPEQGVSKEKSLLGFTPRELMSELHRRGYEGVLTYTKKVDISKI